jgi:hypothetical protein
VRARWFLFSAGIFLFTFAIINCGMLSLDLTKGTSIKILGWGEAVAGHKADGSELYHDYAFDALKGNASLIKPIPAPAWLWRLW